MADIDHDGFGPDVAEAGLIPVRAGTMTRLVNLAGASLSLALVAGLIVWGYELMVRDVAGIPVVRALEGPMRVQPDDPGGQRAAYQGLAVNRIAAVGEAAPPPEEIVLAPRSSDLQSEDLAQGILRVAPAIERQPEPRAEPEDPVAAAILAATTQVMSAEAEFAGDAPELEPAASMPPAPAALVSAIPASTPGPARSPRPRLRPEGFVAATALAATSAEAADGAEVAVAPATPNEPDPASLPPGTRLIQFGAFDSAEEARAAWVGLEARFGALMAGKDRVIEQAETGGQTFYRLRAAGFDDLADSRRFCAVVIAGKGECIPVLAR